MTDETTADDARRSPEPPVGPDASLWFSWLTTEHYNLQTQRAATIGEANGRASVYLGALSAGLIALGFASTAGRSAAITTFQVLVLSSMVLLGTLTFVRCVQIAIDDWDFNSRIQVLRTVYGELLPALARRLGDLTVQEQSKVMLRPRLARLQSTLTIAGSLCLVTAVVTGSDMGVLVYGAGAPLAAAIGVGSATGVGYALVGLHFQNSRWHTAEVARDRPLTNRPGHRGGPM